MQTHPSRLSVHDPDGVPHEIVGLTWIFTIGAAICALAALTIGGAAFGRALLAVPIAVIALARCAGSRRAAQTKLELSAAKLDRG